MQKTDVSYITLPQDFHKITDFYIPVDNFKHGLYYIGKTAHPIFENEMIFDFIEKLLELTKLINPEKQFNLELLHDGKRIILRGHSIISQEGKMFIYRRLPSYIPRLEDLGFPQKITEILLADRLNQGGLVIIAGETGQGKSTTAGAMLSYRLRNHGSFCLTIEDPIELPLQGYHINENNPSIRGVCYQTETTEATLVDSIKSSMRCYPSISNNILFLGETRDSLTASEVLKVAANGHLVVTTFHGADIMNSLRRFLSLASSAPGSDEKDVKQLFSSVFRLLIHQKLEIGPDQKKKIRPTILFSSSHTSKVAIQLRSTSNIDLLSTEIIQQNQAVQQGKSILFSN